MRKKNLFKYVSTQFLVGKTCPPYFLLVTALMIILTLPALADDNNTDDWSDIYKGYNDAQYGKPVSSQEFNNAVKTIKKYKGTDKENKKVQKGGVSTGENLQPSQNPKEVAKPVELPDAAGLLFLLPTSVSLGESTIEKGFYLAESADKDNNHFIRLTRGEGQIVADIQANATDIDRIQTISGGKTSISSEIMNNGMLKITLIDTKYILEAYLWAQ
jgi:hypothetical protein